MDAYAVQFRRGSTDEHQFFIGKDGELTVDTTTWTVRVHDGVTPGGHNAARVDLGNVNLTDLRDRMDAIEGSTYVKLDDQGRLPAVDGSQLTNLPGQDYAALKSEIIQELINEGLLGDNMPVIGSVKMGYANPGDDYITANGSLYSSTDYPQLAASIGDKYIIDAAPFNMMFPTVSYELVNQTITDVATSGSVIVAVGAGGGYWRSADDGRTWARGTIAAAGTATLNSVCFGKGMFVAVSATGTIYTSADGLTWTTVTPNGVSGALTLASFVGNVFLVAGTGGQILASPDGSAWSVASTGVANATINCFASVGSLYLAGGTGGFLQVSTNQGTSWSASSVGHTNPINAIAANPSGTIVVVGGTGTTANVSTSTDGSIWTTRSTTVAQARTSLIWSSALSLFMSGGLAGTVITSPDGTTWTTQSAAATAFTTSSAVIGLLDRGSAVVGINATGIIVQATSAAAYTVKATGRGVASKLIPGATAAGAFVFGTSAIGVPTINKTLDNGSSWYQLSSGSNVVGGRNPSHDGTLNICTCASPVGVFNSRETSGRQLQVLSGVAAANMTYFLNGKFWVVGNFGGLASSVDGRAWNTNFSIPATANLSRMGYGNGIFIVAGANGAIYSSSDGGETWTAITHTLGAVTFNSIMFSNGTFVIGNSTTPANILVSLDGVTFTTRTISLTAPLGSMVVNGNFFMWNSSAMIKSADGVTWTSSSFGASVSDVAFGNGLFMAVGGSGTTPFTAISADGQIWTPKTGPSAGVSLGAVSFVSGSFITIGSPAGVSGQYFQTSTQGAPGGQFWNTRTNNMAVMPTAQWISIPNVGAFAYGVTNGGGASNAFIPYPAVGQFRAPNILSANGYDGTYYIKAR
jgi:photosystem II stability/assembly factor-like uncharacterized protein